MKTVGYILMSGSINNQRHRLHKEYSRKTWKRTWAVTSREKKLEMWQLGMHCNCNLRPSDAAAVLTYTL